MPRHLHNPAAARRWLAAVIIAVVVAGAVVGGLWWTGSRGTTTAATDTSALPSAPGPSASTSASAGPASPTGQTSSPAPAAATAPATTPAPDPKTGRVSTLGGLVPDFALPPIENGLAPVLTRIPTKQKVVFLTIDDGAIKRASDLALLEKNGIKASLFLAHTFIAGHADFYQGYLAAGHLVENHSMTHDLGFIHLGYAQQKAEICQMADFEEAHFGRRPVFFRPPGGPYTDSVRKAVADCGLAAVVDWEAKANAKSMQYQVGQALRPGDIVLMHFRPEFPQDLAAFVKAQKAAGLKVVLLEDYLGVK
ncbi:polysaccharide deacetylase family protein [Specibacter sp. RAF43]|uniref:polysaccharide deacetylase family protein n=1 Tax=Specibacter sp. RAF43 TaxID=3233057 RepID=UPI003F969C75